MVLARFGGDFVKGYRKESGDVKRRPGGYVPEGNPPKAAPIIQVMPERKVRIDPTVIEHITAWIIAFAVQWQRQIDANKVYARPADKAAASGRDKWCEHAIAAAQMIVHGLSETIPIERFDSAMRAARATLAAADECHTPPVDQDEHEDDSTRYR